MISGSVVYKSEHPQAYNGPTEAEVSLGTTQKRPASDKRDGSDKDNTTSLLQTSEPGINLFAGLVLSVAVARLETTLQLVALAVDRGEIIVSEFAPLLLHLAFYLFPISFNSVPVHCLILCLDHLG